MNTTETKSFSTARELAQILTGREYGEEITDDESKQAKKLGLVVVFGYSDDNVEFCGAIDGEIGACGGVALLVDKYGLLPDREQIDDDEVLEKYFQRKRANPPEIEALWCKEGDYSWTFKTEIPHETFEVVEDGKPFCRGIVFSMKDL